jgi:hypothetical protein
MTEAEMQESWQRISRWEDEMKSTGALLFSGRLDEPHTSTMVRMEDGKLLTTDGPFVESKEHLCGFYIIEAADLAAALNWGSPTPARGRTTPGSVARLPVRSSHRRRPARSVAPPLRP